MSRYVSDDERQDARMEEVDARIRWAVCKNGHRFDPHWAKATRVDPACPRVDTCPECGEDRWEEE
jgi:hypothetical protein